MGHEENARRGFATQPANYSALTPLAFLRRSAEVFPAKQAIVYGSRTWTYAQFKADAEPLALAIKAQIEPGDRVAFLTPNVPETLIAHFAVPLAGGVLVTLNSRLAAHEIAYILEYSGAKIVFADAELIATAEAAVGELVLRGNNVMLGYFQDDAAADEVFAGGWFHTGDLGVMHPYGYIEIKDRAKDIIISGGENISTIEVENAILSHPSVLDVAVIGVHHDHWGERPLAYVVPKPGAQVVAVELLDHVRSQLAAFKVPDAVRVVDELPRTATGKVQKFALRGAH